jgi:hypothetical protein
MQNAWSIIIIAQPILFKRDYILQKSLSMMLDNFNQGEGVLEVRSAKVYP